MTDPASIPRDSRRVPLETRVQFKFDRFSGFLSEFSANISPGGMYIRSQTPQENGTVLDFEFRLGDGYELIKGRGEVVWSRPYDEGPRRPAGMGIRFLELSEGSLDLIYKIVDQHVLQGGTPFDVARDQPPAARGTGAVEPFALPGRPTDDPLDESILTLHGLDRRPPLAASGAGVEDDEPKADARSWMPPFEDLETPGPHEPLPPIVLKSPDEAADEAWAPPSSPAPPPAVSTPTFGVAGAGRAGSSREARRGLPLVLAIVGFALIAGVYFLRDRIAGWTGLDGGEPVEVRAGARPDLPQPFPPRAATGAPETATSDLAEPEGSAGETSDLETPPPAVAAAPSPALPAPQAAPSAAPPPSPKTVPPQAAAPVPAKAAPQPAINPPVEAKGFSGVERITFEKGPSGTDVFVWLDGSINASRYSRSELGGTPPRILVKLRGVKRRFADGKIPVGSSEVLQVRTGYHPEGGLNELHVVLDLAKPNVAVTQVEEQPRRLRIHLQGK